MLSKTSLLQFNSPLNISSTTLEICHLCEWCLFFTTLQFIPYFCISVYITLWGMQSTINLNLLRCVWRCLRTMSLILNRFSSFARVFVLLTCQTPQEGICRPNKSHQVDKILPAFGWLDRHYRANLDFFESPGLEGQATKKSSVPKQSKVKKIGKSILF